MGASATATGAQGAGLRHDSRLVYCNARQQEAVISVIERTDCRTCIRFVLWCSLRGIGECGEGCLRSVLP
jgi:hypothetical protein